MALRGKSKPSGIPKGSWLTYDWAIDKKMNRDNAPLSKAYRKKSKWYNQ